MNRFNYHFSLAVALGVALSCFLFYKDSNRYLTCFFGIVAVAIILLLMRREGFQIAVGSSEILGTNADPIEVRQNTQELMIQQLEDKISQYRSELQSQVRETEENEIPRIQIRNSCGEFGEGAAIARTPPAASENISLSNEIGINRGQVPQI
jgi:predicted membrane GTPase involved in stress response